jgi:hypothetical protein
MSKLYYENIVLGVAYRIIDFIADAPKVSSEQIGDALASATRSLVPAIAVTYAAGYAFGWYYHKARAIVEKSIILGEEP